MLHDTLIKSGVSWFQWQSVEAVWHEASIHVMCSKTGAPWASGGHPPQALIFSRGATFITWHLRCLFLGEYQLGSRHFWNHGVCVGYSPMPGSHKKEAKCHTLMYEGCLTNIKTAWKSTLDTCHIKHYQRSTQAKNCDVCHFTIKHVFSFKKH